MLRQLFSIACIFLHQTLTERLQRESIMCSLWKCVCVCVCGNGRSRGQGPLLHHAIMTQTRFTILSLPPFFSLYGPINTILSAHAFFSVYLSIRLRVLPIHFPFLFFGLIIYLSTFSFPFTSGNHISYFTLLHWNLPNLLVLFCFLSTCSEKVCVCVYLCRRINQTNLQCFTPEMFYIIWAIIT